MMNGSVISFVLSCSVCLSVCLLHTGIVSNRLNLGFLRLGCPRTLGFLQCKDVAEVRMVSPAKKQLLTIITPFWHSETIQLQPAKAIIRHNVILCSLWA